MRWFACSTALLALAMVVASCTTVDPSECWLNTSGGFGGSGSIPIGAGVGVSSGDFGARPPYRPLDAPGPPNPCIEAQSPCVEACLMEYANAAGVCGNIESAAQRKSCQDAAYATYRSCAASCAASSSKSCQDMFDACQDIGGKCTKGYPGCDVHRATSCKSCLDACKSGSSYPPACKCSRCGFTQ